MKTKSVTLRRSTVLVLGVLLAAVAAGGWEPQQPTPPQQPAPQVELNTILMESTFRLEGKNAKGETLFGTSFLLGRPMTKDPSKLRFVLVTAAHVVEAFVGDQAVLVLRHRVNGHWERLPVALPIRSNNQPLYVKHVVADIIALYVKIPQDAVPQILLPAALLADDKTLVEYEIHPGDEVMCLGFPLGATSNEAGFPVLRSGKISSYPLIPTAETKTFLYDFPVFQGNSGGPVYLTSSNRVYAGAIHIGVTQMLLGVVIEEEFVTQSIKELYSSTERRYPLGLAKVAHARFVKEAIAMLPDSDIVK